MKEEKDSSGEKQQKRKKSPSIWEETRQKEFQILRVQSFHPGCLEDQVKPKDEVMIPLLPELKPQKRRKQKKVRRKQRPVPPFQGEKGQDPTLRPEA